MHQQVIIEGGATGQGGYGGAPQVEYGAQGGAGGFVPGYGQAPAFVHPVPPQPPPPPSGIPRPQLLPSGAQVVGYVDHAAKSLPWWFWLGLGVAGYHFLVVRPVWKGLRRSNTGG